MTAAVDMPYWPRCMQANLAAPYCGVSKSTFLSGVKAGRYAAGVPTGGNMIWYREDLDVSLTALKGIGADTADPFMEALNG